MNFYNEEPDKVKIQVDVNSLDLVRSRKKSVYKEAPYTDVEAYVDLVRFAKEQEKAENYNGDKVAICSELFSASYASIGRRWDWNGRKVKTFFNFLEKNGLIEAVEKPMFKNRTFKFNESPMYRDDFGIMSFYSDVEHNKFPHSNSNS